MHFYKNRYPELGENVVVEVTEITDFGATVLLLEYDIKGIIMNKEVSRRRMRSRAKFLKVGKMDVMSVMTVDEKKGYIDLSKRYVTEDDKAECIENFNKSKSVHNIATYISEVTKKSLIDILESIIWPMYDVYDHAIDRLIEIANDKNIEDLECSEEMTILVKEAKAKFAKKPEMIKKYVKMTCFTGEGIDAIKESLISGKIIEDGTKIDIRLLHSSTYTVSYTTVDNELGIKNIDSSISIIKKNIEERGGELTVVEDV